MTLIVGIEDPANGCAIVATDSGAWRGDQADVLLTPKIWRSNGWIAGVSGPWTASQRLRHLHPFQKLDADATREQAEAALVAWSWEAAQSLADLDRVTGRTGPEATWDASVLVAHGAHIWYVCSGCVTGIARGHQAIGCDAYALGALSALTLMGEYAPIDLAEMTMRSVQRITKSISPPYRWMATNSQEGVWR